MIHYLGLDTYAYPHPRQIKALLTKRDRQKDAVWESMPGTGTKVNRLRC